MFETIREPYFSSELVPGITAQYVEDTTLFWQVVEPLMQQVFPPFQSIGAYEMPEACWARSEGLGAAFAQSHHERFVFYAGQDQAVGWSYGNLRDRVTFFMISTGLLPAYRQHGIYRAFLRRFLSYLYKLGYERVVSNHQTNNRVIIIAKLKAGFNVTSVNLDERWGAQVELTYLFDEERRRGYERAFALEGQETPISHSGS